MRGTAVAASFGLHGLIVLTFVAAGLIPPFAPPPPPYAEVELVMRPVPTLGSSTSAAQPPGKLAPSKPPRPAPPPTADGVAPPPTPAPASAAAPARDATPSAPGIGQITGDHVIPATPEEAKNAPPSYPVEAVQRGEQGLVEMLIHVAPDGSAASVDITTTSGFPDLDAAARKTVQGWHFRPARRDGVPVASELPFNIHYLLPKPGAPS